MRRLILILLACLPFMTACSKEEIIPYDLVLCDSSFTAVWEHMTANDMPVVQNVENENIHEYMTTFEGSTYKVQNLSLEIEALNSYISNLSENLDGINSVTVFSQSLSDEQSGALIGFARENNIPIIFAVANVPTDVLQSYDKAFAIDSDYRHAAEITAEKMTDLWHEDIIVDVDDNQIFKFAIINDEALTEDLQIFHDNLIADIELYGIPLQIDSEINAVEVDSLEKFNAIADANEAVITITSAPLSAVSEYTPNGSGKEIISVTHDTTDIYAENPGVLNCYINYTDYQKAIREIINNFNNEIYLLEDISYPFVEKTVYISAII